MYRILIIYRIFMVYHIFINNVTIQVIKPAV